MGNDESNKRDLVEGIRTQASEPKIFEQVPVVETLGETAAPTDVGRAAMPPIAADESLTSATPKKSLVEGLLDERNQPKIHEK